ncbi:MAG TPA: SMP-30/gluconolactonase/LRE family protein [Anaeromyxobacteraceae bacterium]|nr:SMP-30/gluconolactonase/LRE family protein [Anaeromyxobacteraceae bacterium]
MRQTVLRGLAMAVAALLAWLLFWPVPIEPKAWRPPPAPRLEGRYAPNDALARVELLGKGQVRGPEATAVDAAGRVYTGAADGRILRLDPSSGAFETVASTGGRPLGLAFGPEGTLYVCDAVKGLLSLAPGSSQPRVLATGHGGIPFRLADDVDVGADGTVYFSDASSRFGIGQTREDVMEHAGAGRLLAWRPSTGTTELLLSGLQFANGVAVAGDGASVLVNETGAYRITRYWLDGPRKGTSEVFFDNLPGLPDNLTFSRSRGAFWVALYSPRVKALDDLAPYPFLRQVVLRLPMWLQPQPAPHAIALGIDLQGQVVANLQNAGPGAFAPLTSVREHGGWLWLGSLSQDALGRVRAP